jgi:hypothetical protein
MKIFGLLSMLGLISVMTVILTAMSADVAARLSLEDRTPLAGPTVSAAEAPPVGAAADSPTQLASEAPAAEVPRKKGKKRSLAACARVTSTCWSST